MARRVVFDATLYAAEAVEAAAEAYREHARVSVRSGANGIVAALEGEPEEDLVRAFCNHALFETVSSRRRRALAEGA